MPVYKIDYVRPTNNIQGVGNVRVCGWLEDIQSIFGSFEQKTLLSQTHDHFFEKTLCGGGDGGMLEGSHIPSP